MGDRFFSIVFKYVVGCLLFIFSLIFMRGISKKRNKIRDYIIIIFKRVMFIISIDIEFF